MSGLGLAVFRDRAGGLDQLALGGLIGELMNLV